MPIVFFALSLSAQKPSKEYKNLFIEGYSNMQYGIYKKAIKFFKEIEDLGFKNGNISYNTGLCYLNLEGDKSRAIPYLKHASQNITQKYKEGSYKELMAPPEAIFYLAKAYRIDEQLDKAIDTYKEYKKQLSDDEVFYHDFVSLQIQTCKNAKELIKSPVPYKKTNLGPTINNSDDNFNPVITPDGDTMIYTTLQTIYDKANDQESFYAIINYVTKENGKWKKPLDITSKINSDGYFTTVGLSEDGINMFFFRDDYGDGNLYKAKKKGYLFTEVEEMDRDINSRDWESHISPATDGKTFYFVSTMKGGQGGRDIYVIKKDKKGKWEDPVNLGKTINTQYDEDCPVISEDGKTLYFCSEAHNSIGGYDIFYSTKDASGNWSTPLNIGYPINTTDDDIFFMPYENGKYALFAHRDPDDSYGKKDIYKYQLKFDEGEEPEVTTPELATTETTKTESVETEETQSETPTEVTETETGTEAETETKETTETGQYASQEEAPTEQTTEEKPERYKNFDIRGIIILPDSNEITSEFDVKVTNSVTNTVAGTTSPNSEGKYSVTVPPGDYIITYTGPGYEKHMRTVSIPPDYGLPKITLDVQLTPKPVARGEYVLMRGVLFDYNSTNLTKDARIKLEKLYNLMKENKQLYVEVTGYSDPSGNTAYNKKLSAQRARNVINYFVNKGISRERFIAKAKGESEPLVSANNKNPEAQRYNRRVEINVVRTGDMKITYQEFRVPEHLRFGAKGVKMQYTILLTDSPKPLSPSHFSNVEKQGVSNVWIFPSANGYAYTIGKYASRGKASTLLNKAVDMGFPNAEIINFRELEKKKHRGQVAIQKRIEKQNQGNGEYTIQLAALKVPVETSYFKNIDGVKRVKGKDGLYRYIWGQFEHSIALQKRKELIDMGYSGAFIMNIDYYKK